LTFARTGMPIILPLLVILAAALYFTTPEERARLARALMAASRRVMVAVARNFPEAHSFRDALRARTGRVLVTPAVLALNAMVFACMVAGPGSLGDPETLAGWGGSVGPRTTNGEWWRLVTALFVHSGPLHLLVSLASLLQLGVLLERLVGHLAFSVVYVGSGLLAGLVSLSANTMAVNVGASGAVFGLYGLLLASLTRSALQRSGDAIPLGILKRLGPAGAVFMLYGVATGRPGVAAALAGLATGFAGGLALATGVGERKAPARRAAFVVGATVMIAAAFAVPLRGVADVRPEIARIIAAEDRTVHAYRKAVDQFRLGALPAEALASLIDRTIVPELRAADGRLKALTGVPREHRPLVAGAEEYLRLRDESWSLRAEGLHKSDMPMLRRADLAERASLEVLEQIRPAGRQ
jgi:rhomboid protease GluP